MFSPPTLSTVTPCLNRTSHTDLLIAREKPECRQCLQNGHHCAYDTDASSEDTPAQELQRPSPAASERKTASLEHRVHQLEATVQSLVKKLDSGPSEGDVRTDDLSTQAKVCFNRASIASLMMRNTQACQAPQHSKVNIIYNEPYGVLT